MNRREMLLASGGLAVGSLIPLNYEKIYPTVCDELNSLLNGGFKPGVLYLIHYEKEFDTNATGFMPGFFPLAGWSIYCKLKFPKPPIVCNYGPNTKLGLSQIPNEPEKDYLHFISWPYNKWVFDSYSFANKIQYLPLKAEEILNSWI